VTWFGFGGNDETGPGDSAAENDLSGTGVAHFTPDFTDSSGNTGPNNNFDQLGVVGTAGVDHLTVSGPARTSPWPGSRRSRPRSTSTRKAPCGSAPLNGDDVVDSSGRQTGLP